MSWQETLDKVVSFVSHDERRYKRDDKLFNENIIIEILNNKRVISSIRKWFDNKSKVDRDISQKDFERAEYFRQEGNKYYLQGINAKALECYNDSIRHYPLKSSDAAAVNSSNRLPDNKGLSLAFANRSAVFFNWKQYRKCLTDIEQAFELQYPDNLQYKLLKRRAECLLELGEFEAAKAALLAAKESLIDNNEKMKAKGKVMSSIDELERKIHGSVSGEKKEANTNEDKVLQVAFEGNEQLLDASDGIKIGYAPKVGRYLVAERSFHSGDVLIVENPFASAVLQKLYKSHCRHCLQKADDMVPCNDCCTQTYCSEECRKDSWQQKHYFECGHLVRLHEVGIASIALHIVLRTEVKTLLEQHINTLTGNATTEMPFGLQNEKIFSDYRMIYNLTLHTKNMTFYNIIEYAITAIALLMILKEGSFFERPEIVQLRDVVDIEYGKLCQESLCGSLKHGALNSINFVELLYGSLMFKHILQIICNGIAATAICDIKDSESQISTYAEMRLGTGIYAVASLLNHSCDPNCIQTFAGNTLVIKAAKEVKAGKELTISYGPLFSKQNWEERQNILKDQYYFTCSCERCINGPDDETDFFAYKCQNCEGPISDLDTGFCPSCMEPFNGDWYRQEHSKVFVPMQKFLQPSGKELKELKKTLKIGEKIFYKYNWHLSKIHSTIACSYALLDNYPKATLHFEKTLAIQKVIHGEESIEVGHSLETYSELLMECLQMKMLQFSGLVMPDTNEVWKCLSIVQKAIKILSIAYASVNDSQELKDLKEREKYLFEMLRNKKE